MSLNKNFDGLAPVGLPILWCPPHAPDDVVPGIVSDSFHNGVVSINTFPTSKRSGGGLVTSVPHLSDARLFVDGKPTELAKRTGWWMFPKWYEDLVEVRGVPDRKSGKVKEAN
jgi:hypothetical protein